MYYQLYVYIPQKNQIVGMSYDDEDLATINYSQWDASEMMASIENEDWPEPYDGGSFSFDRELNIPEEIIKADGNWPHRIVIAFLLWLYDETDPGEVMYFVMRGNDR